MRSIYSARNGMMAQQKRLDVLSNNLANINTDGFKRSRADFQDCLYQTIGRPIPTGNEVNTRMGHGTILGATTKIMSQGKMLGSDLKTDMAIEGEGFFAIESQEGVTYTRHGSFSVDNEGFLVTKTGAYVLDNNFDRIYVADENFTCDNNGNIIVAGQENVTLGIFNCPNPEGLESVGLNQFIVGENSGEMAQAEQGFIVRQNCIEGSNVELEKEITYMIRSQRALSLASRAMTAADNMDAQANQLRQ